jgi:hypothetical protein
MTSMAPTDRFSQRRGTTTGRWIDRPKEASAKRTDEGKITGVVTDTGEVRICRPGERRCVLGHMFHPQGYSWKYLADVRVQNSPGEASRECAYILCLKTITIILIRFEAPHGASTFGDGDLNTDTKMSVQRSGNMFLLLLWIKGLSEFQSNSSIDSHWERTFGVHKRICYR